MATSRRLATPAKLSRPRQRGILERGRLFEAIDNAANCPILWISGPAGCGKTTLVSSYVVARRLVCLWYQLDTGDTDPATFFHYMGLAAKKAAPRRRKPLPPLTPEYLQDIPTFTRRFFENVFSRLKTPCIVVFDNYQEVPPESELHQLISQGLRQVPEGITVILISRGGVPPALARLRANNRVHTLGWNDLRLRTEESRAIARLRMEEPPSEEVIQRLHGAAGGWAAGLVLMLERAKAESVEPQVVGGASSPEEIFDYFASEVFNATDDASREFLLKTAFLVEMSSKMAEELADDPNAGRILSEFHRNNYFTEKRLGPSPTYQYHSLFRRYLLEQAEKMFLPEKLSVLRRRAAVLLQEAGQTESATALYRDVRDWDALAGLIKTQAPTMLRQGRNRVLEEWLNVVPEDVLESDPWLLFWRGVCLLPFDQLRSRRSFEKAFAKFDKGDDQIGMMMSWSGIVDSLASSPDYQQLQRWIKVYEDRMPPREELPSGELGARVASSMFTALVLGQTDHPDIDLWGDRALLLTGAPETVGMHVQVLAHMVLHYAWKGSHEEGAFFLDSLKALTKHHLSAMPLVAIIAKQAESIFNLFAGRYDQCLRAVNEGLEISRVSGVHVFDYMLLSNAAESALALGDLETAEDLLMKMSSCLHGPRPLEPCVYHFLRARQALAKRDFQEASAHAERAVGLASKVGAPIFLMSSFISAQVMHALGKEHEADRYLAASLDAARRIRYPFCEFFVSSAAALFAFDRGQKESGLESLQKLLALGRTNRYFHFPFIPPADAARICVKALEAGIEIEYVRECIRRRKLIPEEPPVHLENWPWPVKIYTLGRFGLLVDDQPVRFSRKAQQKPMDMLKSIIAFGGRNVREERISDVLWADVDGDMAHSSFASTLHRLRKMIGYQDALQLRGGGITLDPRYCWVDIWAFERMLGQADSAWDGRPAEGDSAEAVALTQKAIGMYRGPFLGGEMREPWTISLRERLRSKFLRAVGKLGQHWEKFGEWEKALECYDRALEADDLAEESYQRIMLCYQKLGRTADALATYERCRKTLASALGVAPSRQTEAVRASLLSEKKS